MKKNHLYFMNVAYRLALKAKGNTSPNPMVGAVVVKSGKILSKGYHRRPGEEHAEVIAINKALNKAKNATLYVTLEPCTHFGRTPPCADFIIKSGMIREVIVGMIDPNPLNNGKGVEILKKNKIIVKVGYLEDRLKKMNESFIKYITKGLPFVTVKVAQSLDGKIATKTGNSKWITTDKSRVFAHKMRAEFDAVMVGVNTVLRDDPKLDSWFSKRNPKKIIIDSQLSTPENSRIFSSDSKVIIVTLKTKPGQETENRKILSERAEILEVKEKSGQINLKDAFRKLAKLGIANILVEGGGTLIGSLFDEGLVDKVLFFISPKIIGGKEAIGSVLGKGITRVEKAIKLKDVKLQHLGEDVLVSAYV